MIRDLRYEGYCIVCLLCWFHLPIMFAGRRDSNQTICFEYVWSPFFTSDRCRVLLCLFVIILLETRIPYYQRESSQKIFSAYFFDKFDRLKWRHTVSTSLLESTLYLSIMLLCGGCHNKHICIMYAAVNGPLHSTLGLNMIIMQVTFTLRNIIDLCILAVLLTCIYQWRVSYHRRHSNKTSEFLDYIYSE